MKQQFQDNPEYYLKYCKAIESELNVRFKLILNDTPEAMEAKEVSIGLLKLSKEFFDIFHSSQCLRCHGS
jgi:hypothetical protein